MSETMKNPNIDEGILEALPCECLKFLMFILGISFIKVFVWLMISQFFFSFSLSLFFTNVACINSEKSKVLQSSENNPKDKLYLEIQMEKKRKEKCQKLLEELANQVQLVVVPYISSKNLTIR